MNLLRERGFALLWIGQSLSSLADWALRAVVLIWVYALTGSGVAVSVVGLAEALPLLLAAPFAGVFVDRWNRAYTMAGAVVARAIVLLPLLTVNGRANVPIIVAVTLFANVAAQFFMPAASAAVPVVAGPERVGQANSILSLSTAPSPPWGRERQLCSIPQSVRMRLCWSSARSMWSHCRFFWRYRRQDQTLQVQLGRR